MKDREWKVTQTDDVLTFRGLLTPAEAAQWESNTETFQRLVEHELRKSLRRRLGAPA